MDYSEGSYYFTVTREKATWDVEITWFAEDNLVSAYSSIPVDVDTTSLPSILETINKLNLSNDSGNFQCSPVCRGLYFKNAFLVIESSLETQLTWLLEGSFEQMAGIAAVVEKLGAT